MRGAQGIAARAPGGGGGERHCTCHAAAHCALLLPDGPTRCGGGTHLQWSGIAHQSFLVLIAHRPLSRAALRPEGAA